MRNIITCIEIKAPIEAVWSALTDLPAYGLWNPFIVGIDGTWADDSIIAIQISPPGRKRFSYKVRILKTEQGRELIWAGRFYAWGPIDGVHAFQLFKIDDELTRVIQRECFTGLSVPFVWRGYLNTSVRKGFEKSNLGLKRYLEEGAAFDSQIRNFKLSTG